jgi:hypothetical protein
MGEEFKITLREVALGVLTVGTVYVLMVGVMCLC